jgi:NAD(P)-dependent dehydrogenase (short-subunit alcohol dehydrogenase family)
VSGLSNLFDLTGKAAFVTGASSGIGLHVAQMLARAGAAVALGARRVDRIEEAVAGLRGEGRTACAVPLDVTKPDSINNAVASAESQLGQPLDILFNNAGIVYTERFLSQELGEIEKIFDTNLKGAFLVMQAVARGMAARRSGAIINISSSSGLRAGGYMSSYGSSKAGLIHLTQIAAIELASKGVRVNAICPGNMQTDMMSAFDDHGLTANVIQRIPMRRVGDVSELDGVTLLLASRAGSYMTGAVIPVDGGQALSWM